MENNEPKTINVDDALQALAMECVKLDRRTVELMQTAEGMTNAMERILRHHQIACRRTVELLITLGADPEALGIRELRSLFNLESPDGDKGPKQN